MGNPGGDSNRTACGSCRLLHPFEFRGRLHRGPDRTRAVGANGRGGIGAPGHDRGNAGRDRHARGRSGGWHRRQRRRWRQGFGRRRDPRRGGGRGGGLDHRARRHPEKGCRDHRAAGQRRAARDRPGSRRGIPSRGTGAPRDRRRQDPRHSLEFSVSVREGRSSCALFVCPGAALRRQPVECRLVREEKYTMAANRTPAPLRLVRLARLALHLVRGLAIAWLRYPKLSEAEQNAQKRRWSRTLLSILSVSVREQNAPKKLPERCMLALNHISWLDIFVIDATFPATFVAKSEVRSWPVVGWLCTLVGTLYIERGKRSAAVRARQAVAGELERGALVAVCPEGITTSGRSLERFHAALFQPALDAAATLQPVALRYLDAAGRHTDAAGYVGDTSLFESVWTIVSTRHMVAEFNLLAPISVRAQTRRSLAEKAETAIARALGVPGPQGLSRARHRPRTVPGTNADPPDEPR